MKRKRLASNKMHELRIATTCLLATLWITCAVCACDRQTLYHASQPLPSEGWKREDTLHFPVNVTDSQGVWLNFYVDLRHRSNYPYRNLALRIHCVGPDSMLRFDDSLQVEVAKPEGTWKGTGWGGLYLLEAPMGKWHADSVGVYTVNIWHNLTDSLLVGVNDIGIRLTSVRHLSEGK